MSQRQYLMIIEKTEKNYSAYCPDVPGCVTTGKTRKEVERNMHEALELHFDGMNEDGLEIPKATATATYIVQEIPARRKTSLRRKSAKVVRRSA